MEPKAFRTGMAFPVLILVALGAGCEGEKGDPGPPGPPGPPASSSVSTSGLAVEITGLAGGSGAGGAFQPGDSLSVTFTVKDGEGNRVSPGGLAVLAGMVSGPTFNYQRVLARRTDLAAAAVENADGSATYTFPEPLPPAYLPPLNDTASFGSGDGELAGQPLLSGTYTVGLEARREVDEEGETVRYHANATGDFLLGTAAALAPREVVRQENCSQCHQHLEAHGGLRLDVKLCLLCHTSGSEDRNNAAVEGGTPGASIDFRVMIHKIHNASHLPSVLGVATNSDGSRNYAATPQPYRLVGFQDSVIDFSKVVFPLWPNLSSPMPRDQGYTALTTDQKGVEDTIRSGVTGCEKCHGDPDGAGPLGAPSEGELVYAQPTQRACGSCHDDIDWAKLYTSNNQTMPVQQGDSACVLCHPATGNALAVRDCHLHPFEDPGLNAGLQIEVLAFGEGAGADGDGTLDPGELVSLTLALKDDSGVAVTPSQVASMNVVVSGPLENRNLLLSSGIPLAALTVPAPFTLGLPQARLLEFVGDSSTDSEEVFTTSRAPHWNMSGATTSVRVRTGTSGSPTSLDAAARAFQNYLDLASVSGLARNDFLVMEDGVAGQEEYVQILLVEVERARVWINPATRLAHAQGAAVQEAVLEAKSAPGDYTLNAAAGTITEATDFGDGAAVLVSYTADFVMPAAYPPPFNDSPDLDEDRGEWRGKPLLDGTYTVGLWGSRDVVVALHDETQTYRGTSPTATRDFLVGSASQLSSSSVIPSGEACNACHGVVLFHGSGRRGYENCILCHGAAGSEDRARYTAANAPPTTGLSIEFRTMLHKIHRGHQLAKAATYTVVGFGGSPYPNNYTAHTYGEVVFPAWPDGVRQCTTCHGESSSWKEPAPRDHPDQAAPTHVWTAACITCHDSSAAEAHAAAQTAGGAESCAVCHSEGREFAAELYHQEE